jgi:hypothetical protein
MTWKKLGLVFDPQTRDYIKSHAQVPTALDLGDKIRVFYAARTEKNQSYTLFVDLNPDNLSEVLYEHKESVFSPAVPGAFDDEGIMPSSVFKHEGKVWMYYTGWNKGSTIAYHNATGLAYSEDDGKTFVRAYDGPILDRLKEEPFLTVTPIVFRKDNKWLMWYSSGTHWPLIEGKREPVYVIKHATSDNGIDWYRDAVTCIPQKYPEEAFGNPHVIFEDDMFKMWYCYRDCSDYRGGSGSYMIGYAESKDGKSWERLDEKVGLDVSKDGWDSDMLCYPFVLQRNTKKYMFYNGNGFGTSGFGVAES